jgi:ABC-type polar amino acid transport system ATPase subunit
MVFQRFNLFSHKTVLGNVVEGQVAVLKRRKREAEAKAIEVLRLVGRSGGKRGSLSQRQRNWTWAKRL